MAKVNSNVDVSKSKEGLSMKTGKGRGLYNKIGIYQITCLINNKVYIGSSRNIGRRYNGHLRRLKRNIHTNKYLQNCWNKYGQENFEFTVVEFCLAESLKVREEFYFEITKCCDREFGFNIVKTSGGGYCSGEEHYLYGKSLSKETKKKLSESHKWRTGENHNMYGIPKSNTVKKKISNTLKGQMSGIKNPAAKLSQQDVKQIIERRHNRELLSSLAKDFDVSETQISRIYRGLSWSKER